MNFLNVYEEMLNSSATGSNQSKVVQHGEHGVRLHVLPASCVCIVTLANVIRAGLSPCIFSQFTSFCGCAKIIYTKRTHTQSFRVAQDIISPSGNSQYTLDPQFSSSRLMLLKLVLKRSEWEFVLK